MRSIALLALTAVAARAQASEADPYTGHHPARMRAAGIVALQRFVWTRDHTSVDIQSVVGREPVRFVETAHFRFGVALAPMAVPARGEHRAALRAELTELRRVLPAIDPDAKVLDGWLRAHLYARRFETLYAEFAARFGVTEAALGKAAPGSAADEGAAAGYQGEGPYLGMRDKFLVLLCRDAGSVNDYLRNFLDLPAPRKPLRCAVAGGASLLLAMAETMPDADLREDRTLHAAALYHGAHLLLDGFRHCWHDCPPWFEEGVAHWLRARQVPDRAWFAERPRELPPAALDQPWPGKLAQRHARDALVPAARLFAIDDAAAMSFEDHLAAWSCIDFLLARHAGAFPLVARMLKGPVLEPRPRRPAPDVVFARVPDALAAVFGWTTAEFDAARTAHLAAGTCTAPAAAHAGKGTETRR